MRKFRLLLAAPVALASLTGLAPPPVGEEAEPNAPAEVAEAEPAAVSPEAEAEEAGSRLPPAVATEIFYSSDSDGTEVARAALQLGLSDAGDTRSIGVRVERAHYNPSDRGWESRDRIFLVGAEKLGNW